MYSGVVFVSRFVAQELIPDPNTIMISLTSPNELARIAPGWLDVLRLEFFDISEEVLGVPVGSIPDVGIDGQLMYEHKGHKVRLPDLHHAETIANFLAKHASTDSDFLRVVLVHCDQGKSRSAAVAQFVADWYGVPILNAELEWQDRVSMLDTSCANPRLLRLLKKHVAGA